MVLSTETSIDFCDLLMTSSSSSGEFSTTRGTSSVWRNPCSFQLAATLSQLELICHHFHQLGNTNFSHLINSHWILGFSDSSFSIARTIRSQLCLPLALLFHGSWGPIPGCFSLSWVLGSRPWLFFFLHVHLARVSSNLLLAPWVFHRRF